MRIHVSPEMAGIDYFGIVAFAPFIIFQIFSGDIEPYEVVLSTLYFVSMPFFFHRDREYLVRVSISESCITSRLFFKKRCIISYSCPVYISFFQEDRRGIPDEKYHVMVSNSPLPDFEPGTRLATYDWSKQIMFPDTEKTRRAITPLLSSEFCILQGDAPPPVEELRKKKREKKKEEPPVMKREKSPDDPPPFTGRWNGRF